MTETIQLGGELSAPLAFRRGRRRAPGASFHAHAPHTAAPQGASPCHPQLAGIGVIWSLSQTGSEEAGQDPSPACLPKLP